jgi:tetratricopeptide (TPR) repeat protein
LHIARETGSPQHEIRPLVNLGFALGKQGSYVEARIYLEQSLRTCRETRNRAGEREVLGELGNVSADLGDYAGARAYYEQALHICRENGFPEGVDLSRLGLLCHQLGDGETARQYCQRALRIAQNMGSRSGQGYALTFLGHALMGLGEVVEAADAYRQALALRQEIGQHHLAIESLAGLAGVALAQGDLIQARIHVQEVLSYLDGHPTLHGADEPFRIYVTCYRVLCAQDDPRAEEVLDAGYHLLQERASKIDDEALRRSYLENVPYHREIVAAWEARDH